MTDIKLSKIIADNLELLEIEEKDIHADDLENIIEIKPQESILIKQGDKYFIISNLNTN